MMRVHTRQAVSIALSVTSITFFIVIFALIILHRMQIIKLKRLTYGNLSIEFASTDRSASTPHPNLTTSTFIEMSPITTPTPSTSSPMSSASPMPIIPPISSTLSSYH